MEMRSMESNGMGIVHNTPRTCLACFNLCFFYLLYSTQLIQFFSFNNASFRLHNPWIILLGQPRKISFLQVLTMFFYFYEFFCKSLRFCIRIFIRLTYDNNVNKTLIISPNLNIHASLRVCMSLLVVLRISTSFRVHDCPHGIYRTVMISFFACSISKLIKFLTLFECFLLFVFYLSLRCTFLLFFFFYLLRTCVFSEYKREQKTRKKMDCVMTHWAICV